MRSVILRYGLYTGLLVIVYMNLFYRIFNPYFNNSGKYVFIGFAGILSCLSICYLGIMHYRDRQNQRIISFRKALTIGCSIVTLGALLYLGYYAIDYHFIKPSLLEKDIAYQLRSEIVNNLTPVKLEQLTNRLHHYRSNYSTPTLFIFYTIADLLIIGYFLSFVSALILKKKKKT